MLGASVGSELVVQLPLGVRGQLSERVGDWQISRVKYPSAIGTTPACYVLGFDPH